jgi:hypothetical protein
MTSTTTRYRWSATGELVGIRKSGSSENAKARTTLLPKNNT